MPFHSFVYFVNNLQNTIYKNREKIQTSIFFLIFFTTFFIFSIKNGENCITSPPFSYQYIFRIQRYAVYAGTESHHGCSPYLSRTTRGVRNRDQIRHEDMYRTYEYPDTTTYPSSECSITGCGSSTFHSFLHAHYHR